MINPVFGTHRQGAGAEADYYKYVSFDPSGVSPSMPPLQLTLYSRLGYMYNYKYYGIPGQSHCGEAKIGFFGSSGAKNSFYRKYFNVNEPGTHNFSLYWAGFLTSDGTSQLIGGLYYSYIHERNVFGFEYNNDTFIPYPSDSYRTAAVRIFYYHDTGNNLVGCDFGFKLWAGERKFDCWENGRPVWPEEVHRGRNATLYYGREYSHGIAYVSFILNEFSLSFGYDSEKIRDFIQNTTHYIINDAKVPLVDREDRIYVELKMFGYGSLY
jgi:hypothetical protein